jgi:hypothetical protein
MKQALLFLSFVLFLSAQAQNNCNELFISEYVEGAFKDCYSREARAKVGAH